MFYTGQVILYKNGPNLISKLIRLIQGNKITHCAVVVYEHPTDPYLLEIKNFFSKVRLVKYSQTLYYTNEIYLATYNDIKIITNSFELNSLVEKYSGYKYSGFSLFNATINHFIGLFKKNYRYKLYFTINKKYTCSSLCSTILNSLNITNYPNPNLIEPDDFTIYPWRLERIK